MLERALGTHTPIGIQYLISEWKEVLDKRNEHTHAAQYNIVLLHCFVCAVLVAARFVLCHTKDKLFVCSSK